MTTLQKTAVMIGLAAFVFVVVCPLTVTPTAVTKSAVPLVILIVMPMLAAPVISAGALPEWEHPMLAPERRIDTRLC
jgi:hypothetical protein